MHFLIFLNALQDLSVQMHLLRHSEGVRKLTPSVKCGLSAEGLSHQSTLATAKGESCEPEDWHFKQAPPGMQCSSLLAWHSVGCLCPTSPPQTSSASPGQQPCVNFCLPSPPWLDSTYCHFQPRPSGTPDPDS